MEINNLTGLIIDGNFLKAVAKKVLKERNKEKIDLSIVFVGQERMKKLNQKYRRKNKLTDVLAFGEGLNEIVICPQEVKKNAKRFDSVFKKELARVLIHGILHLLGYNHEKGGKEAEKMEKKQNYYLSLI